MSEQSNPAPSPPSRFLRRLAKVALVTFLLLFLLMFMATGAGAGEIQACIALTFGWFGFLKRTLPQISWNWDLIGMGILCSAVILFLAHRLLNWIARSVGSGRDLSWHWPWKWTICGLIAIALVFLVGMSVGGATHQIGWIAGSNEPWFERKPRYLQDIMDMRELDVEFRQALLDGSTIEAVRKYMWNSDAEKHHRSYQQKSLMQSFHILLVVEPEGKVVAMLIFPRNAERRAKVGGYYATENDNRQISAKDLSETIRSFQGKLIAI